MFNYTHETQENVSLHTPTNGNHSVTDNPQFVEVVAPVPELIVRLPCSPISHNPSLFRCGSNRRQAKHFCIPKAFVCDGEFDCGDGSDEEGCDNVGRNRRGATTNLSVHNFGWCEFSYFGMICA